VLPTQVAARAVNILTSDTQYPGTSASVFQGWYNQNSSLVSGKTGTSVAVVHGRDTDMNAALWFVGMTPRLVASTAVVNLASPSSPARGLPGVPDPAHNAYGKYAAGLWVSALGASLRGQHWNWPKPVSVPGNLVPDVSGMSLAAAKAHLAAAGFKMQQLDAANALSCASSITTGNVAFYGPKRAPRGATITVCPSSGAGQDVYVPPPPPPPPTYIPPPSSAPAPAPTTSAPQPTQAPPSTHSPRPQPKPTHTKPRPQPKPKPKPSKSKPRH
jgi:membrane peptidoglycan carboxypeptidase